MLRKHIMSVKIGAVRTCACSSNNMTIKPKDNVSYCHLLKVISQLSHSSLIFVSFLYDTTILQLYYGMALSSLSLLYVYRVKTKWFPCDNFSRHILLNF